MSELTVSDACQNFFNSQSDVLTGKSSSPPVTRRSRMALTRSNRQAPHEPPWSTGLATHRNVRPRRETCDHHDSPPAERRRSQVGTSVQPAYQESIRGAAEIVDMARPGVCPFRRSEYTSERLVLHTREKVSRKVGLTNSPKTPRSPTTPTPRHFLGSCLSSSASCCYSSPCSVRDNWQIGGGARLKITSDRTPCEQRPSLRSSP